mmetsp:Transcript_82948/g.238387  ORF Transcript_82948/g.238387 Transcript_82948/m.238387 type:complete len:247 (-) Transcript_82948:833-1573(-)
MAKSKTVSTEKFDSILRERVELRDEVPAQGLRVRHDRRVRHHVPMKEVVVGQHGYLRDGIDEKALHILHLLAAERRGHVRQGQVRDVCRALGHRLGSDRSHDARWDDACQKLRGHLDAHDVPHGLQVVAHDDRLAQTAPGRRLANRQLEHGRQDAVCQGDAGVFRINRPGQAQQHKGLALGAARQRVLQVLLQISPERTAHRRHDGVVESAPVRGPHSLDRGCGHRRHAREDALAIVRQEWLSARF